jgi:catechol 2,3-dioxygenase-like lactoylglutathione lyase family enzyme
MNMETVEIKAFVPSRDFELSKAFYTDLGFEVAYSSEDLAYLKAGECAFLLQAFYVKEHATNFMMHMLVEDVDAWWRHVEDAGLVTKYGIRADPPADRPWAIRDFVIVDPSGVLWRIGTNIGSPANPKETP